VNLIVRPHIITVTIRNVSLCQCFTIPAVGIQHTFVWPTMDTIQNRSNYYSSSNCDILLH